MMTTKEQMKIFGTDGVRGRANRLPMTVEMALALGRSVGMMLQRKPGKHRVVVGKDTRLSCYMYENALIAGLCSMGIDTLMLGPFPTPGVSFITRAYRADAGVVISASHNPFYDNGIKFFSSDGYKFPDSWEEEVEHLVWEGNFSQHLPADAEIGKNTKVRDADGRYIEFAKSTFPKNQTLQRMKVVVDCGHGASYRVAPLILQELDAEVFSYGVSPDGLNINLNCGCLHPEQVQKAVIDHHADVGIAFDGDADRVVMVDENAQIVDGDTILAICARDLKQNGLLEKDLVVATEMSNLGFFQAMSDLGIRVMRSSVGDKNVIQDMKKHGANLGGEQSGHIIFLDHNTTGDGIVSALQVLRIMIENDAKLSDLASFVEKYPQVLLNLSVSEKKPIEEIPGFLEEKKRIEKELGDRGRLFVRYSGTENLLRVMIEGPNEKDIANKAKQLLEIARETIGFKT